MRFKKETLWGWLLITPLTAGLILWVAFPVGVSIYMSFFRWNMITAAEFIGIDNYLFMFFKDHLFWQSVAVMSLYTLTSVPLQLLIAFSGALLLNTDIRGKGAFRTIFYLPSLIPAMVSTALWMFLYNPQFGLFNLVLNAVGLPPQPWLTDSDTALASLVLMSLWSVGNITIIFLAGLQNIPKELMEACTVDGGNSWHRLRHITIPFMSPIIFYNLVIGIIGGLQTFTQPYVMTNGGPSNSTLTYVLHLYKQAFQFSKMGYANAMAFVLLLATMLVSLLIFRTSRSWVHYEGDRK
jgi:multiple sugar transport system permease protein